MATTGAQFSYAQAAKGHAAPTPTSSSATPSGSQTPEVSTEQSVADPGSSASSINKPALSTSTQVTKKEATAPANTSQEAMVSDKPVAPASESVEDPTHSGDSQTNVVQVPDEQLASTPLETEVNSKQEEAAAAVPNVSDASWERVSQASQTEGITEPKVEGDDDDSKLSSWEHVQPPPMQFKEAPLPTFNVWDKRAAEAKAKGTDAPTAVPPKANGHATEAGEESGARSLPVAAPEFSNKRRVDSGRTGADDRIAQSTLKDSIRSSNGRAKVASQHVVLPTRNDDLSWPTPESAKDDEKKRTERMEKAEPDKQSGRHHGKEKWEKMDYVPTAVFATPLPTARRGGRAGRGGRESAGKGGHGANGSISGDTVQPTTPSRQSSISVANTSKGDMGPPKPGPLPPRYKRASSAGPAGSADPRKSADEHGLKASSGGRPTESRRISSGPNGGLRQWSPSGRRVYGSESEPFRSQSGQDQSLSRATSERRDQARFPGDGTFRERGEGRGDRSRGGYRGRGGYNGGPGSYTASSQGYTGPPSNRSSTYGPSGSQPFPEQARRDTMPQDMPYTRSRESRHYRAGSRSQPLPSSGFGRFPSNGAVPGSQQLSPIQTDAANMFYPRAIPGIMSAMPYPGYAEQMQFPSILQAQMEYYFSVDNLCKDMFLRRQMDSQGFVFLHVLQNFNRVKSLTKDLEFIRLTCWQSPLIELLTGNDGLDRVRKARDWQHWVLPIEDRDQAARNDGPAQTQQPQFPMMFPPNDGPSTMVNDPASPRSAGHFTHFRPEAFSVNGNGTPNSITDTPTETPLSAAVPDFTPSYQRMDESALQAPAIIDAPDNAFPDNKIEGLKIMVGNPSEAEAEGKTSGLAAPSLSNGSLDTPLGANDTSGLGLPSSDAPPTNHKGPGESLGAGVRRPRSPLVFGTAPRQSSSRRSSPALWTEGPAVSDEISNEHTYESYTTFRDGALRSRKQTDELRSLDSLYQFWSQFLIRNFNLGMYDDFRRLALEDADEHGSMSGLCSLIAFYDGYMLSQKDIPGRIAHDYVELAKNEMNRPEKPAYQKLRAAWRNGALPLKNRLKLDKLVGPTLKQELES